MITSHPVRRKIISILMIIGNAGTVAVIAGLGSSSLNVTSLWPAVRFLVLIIALYFIFKLATHNRLGRALSRKIEEKLRERFKIQKRTVGRILYLQALFSVGKTSASSDFGKKKILVLALEREEERILVARVNRRLHIRDNLTYYGGLTDMTEIA